MLILQRKPYIQCLDATGTLKFTSTRLPIQEGGHNKTGDWPKDEQIPKVRAKSLPACCNPRLSFDLRFLFKKGKFNAKNNKINIAGMNLNIMKAVNRAYLWTVEVDGCLCSCRIVVFSPTAPIIADLFCNSDGYSIEDRMM